MSNRATTIRKQFPRFRILVIGRANTGKTTLLQRVCKTTESPIVCDRWGDKVRVVIDTPSFTNRSFQVNAEVKGTLGASFCLSPTWAVADAAVQRGEHDIEHQISFASNDRFVFHDSRGFEASSEDELRKVQSFVEERGKEVDLTQRLPAIWSKSMYYRQFPHILTLFHIGTAFQ